MVLIYTGQEKKHEAVIKSMYIDKYVIVHVTLNFGLPISKSMKYQLIIQYHYNNKATH